MSNTIVMYHDDCPDGFTGAWLLNRFLTSKGEEPEMVGCKYHSKPDMVLDKYVYMVDFCYDDLEWMRDLIRQAEGFLLLDHHRTGEKLVQNPTYLEDTIIDAEHFGLYEEIDDLQYSLGFGELLQPGDVHLVVDQSHSGAMLAALYTQKFHPADTPEDLINKSGEFIFYVEDRDLWHNALPYTYEINAAIMSYPYDFEQWDEFDTPKGIDNLQQEGEALVRYRDKIIEGQVKLAQRVVIDGIEMLGAPAPYTVASDVAGILAERVTSGIGVYWVDYPGMRKYGLRSTPDGPDVSEICAKYGGGGHTHAAGFSVKGKVEVDVD